MSLVNLIVSIKKSKKPFKNIKIWLRQRRDSGRNYGLQPELVTRVGRRAAPTSRARVRLPASPTPSRDIVTSSSSSERVRNSESLIPREPSSLFVRAGTASWVAQPAWAFVLVVSLPPWLHLAEVVAKLCDVVTKLCDVITVGIKLTLFLDHRHAQLSSSRSYSAPVSVIVVASSLAVVGNVWIYSSVKLVSSNGEFLVKTGPWASSYFQIGPRLCKLQYHPLESTPNILMLQSSPIEYFEFTLLVPGLLMVSQISHKVLNTQEQPHILAPNFHLCIPTPMICKWVCKCNIMT